MKIINIKTNNIFNLPKSEVEKLIEDSPSLYEKVSKSAKKSKQNILSISKKHSQNQTVCNPLFEQNTILPLIWDEK